MSNFFKLLFLALILGTASCAQGQPVPTPAAAPVKGPEMPKIINPGRVVHVLVALCDNVNQGIVPVPAFLGNGEDPDRNLYWGAAFGVKTFFSRSKNWTKLAEIKNPEGNILERIIFKHKTQNVYLVADAYRGSKIRETIDDFFSAVSGNKRETVAAENANLEILGGADLVAFVGHNGLMDFNLDKDFIKKDDNKRDAIILACASRNYFFKPMRNTGAKPLLWTSNLMAPEAYTLHDALEGWIRNESDEQIRARAVSAYARYQRISIKAAGNLLVTGW
jgi:hypothetical protein